MTKITTWQTDQNNNVAKCHSTKRDSRDPGATPGQAWLNRGAQGSELSFLFAAGPASKRIYKHKYRLYISGAKHPENVVAGVCFLELAREYLTNIPRPSIPPARCVPSSGPRVIPGRRGDPQSNKIRKLLGPDNAGNQAGRSGPRKHV